MTVASTSAVCPPKVAEISTLPTASATARPALTPLVTNTWYLKAVAEFAVTDQTRLWVSGLTPKSDVEAVLPWLDWAFETKVAAL